LRALALTALAASAARTGGAASSAPPCVLARSLGDHMVLQHSRPVVHGFAAPGATVRVSLDGAPVGEAAAAAGTGLWRLALPPTPPALAPRALAFACSTGERLALADVLFGHVLLNAGQSNACFTVQQSINASAEAADSARFAPGLRVATVAHTHADAPQLELPDGLMQAWAPVGAAALEGGNFSFFSAVGYFAARGIFSALGEREPVGVITSCVSGTPIQAWSSPDAEAACDGTQPEPGGMNYSALFNSMLAPFAVAPTAFSQVLWTQGEQNADQPAYYACALPALISDLRAKLAQPALPFAFYLLAPWVKSGSNFTALPLTRLAQLRNTSLLASVGVAPAHDLGDPTTPWPGHPRYKQAVGARFAAVALAGAAFNASANVSGPFLAPRFASSRLSADGRSVTVSFARPGLAESCGGRLELNLSVACPTAQGVPAAVCEGVAVQDASGAWVASASDGSGAGPLSVALGADGASVVLTLPPSAPGPALASRGYFADWPVILLRNCAGWPALPWLADANADA
jgi:sialate O-acetylesterase